MTYQVRFPEVFHMPVVGEKEKGFINISNDCLPIIALQECSERLAAFMQKAVPVPSICDSAAATGAASCLVFHRFA